MIAWILRNQRYCLIGLAIVSLCIAVRLWGNHQWAKGEQQGRQAAASDIEKAKIEEWKARETAIAAGEQALASERRQLGSMSDQLNRDREAWRRSFTDSVSTISTERMDGYAKAAATPDDRVWIDIRIISGQLAGADAR